VVDPSSHIFRSQAKQNVINEGEKSHATFKVTTQKVIVVYGYHLLVETGEILYYMEKNSSTKNQSPKREKKKRQFGGKTVIEK